MGRLVEEIFVTEGVPNETFIPPPNFNEILVDIRNIGKPVIIEGQSGTGKTTAVKKIYSQLDPTLNIEYLSARRTRDVERISKIASDLITGFFIVDDFHRLSPELQTKLADIAKMAAEESDPERYPKLVIIGINQVGSTLIQFVPDIAKRCGIHKIRAGNEKLTLELIQAGANALNISIENPEKIFAESKGDYWLTQQLCQTACTIQGMIEGSDSKITINPDIKEIRSRVVDKLNSAYYPAVKEFCRGRRFRPSNDPYFKLLRAVSRGEQTVVDLTELANSNDEVRGSINNIKDYRLSNLLDSKALAARYFFYASETTTFAVEDPAVFYFLKHLNWDALRADCGFRDKSNIHEFDIALSFAGENRALASHIYKQLTELDFRVFYDENFEANYLGKAWSEQFTRIFGAASRIVVCLLDINHKNKIWPTFEREVFAPRIAQGDVVPVFLDDTPFVGIPQDVVGIHFKKWQENDTWPNEADTRIVFKLIDRVD